MSLIELPDLLQGSDEWHNQRRGIVTASVVGQLVAVQQPGALDFDCPSCDAVAGGPCLSKVKRGGVAGAPTKVPHAERTAYSDEHRDEVEARIVPVVSDTSRALTLVLTAERLSGLTDQTWLSNDMWRGIEDEPRARDVYSEHFAPAAETGFMVRDDWGFRIGYSPDGLVGDDGLIEVKSRRQKKQLETILADAVPPENMAQLQCGLLVSGREWIDYVSYCGGMPLWVKRVTPDRRWFDGIIEAVRAFEAAAEHMADRYLSAVVGLPMTERVSDEVELKL